MRMDAADPNLPLTVRSLVCHRHVEMAMACLGSLQQMSAQTIRLILHDDGSLTSVDKERLLTGLSQAALCERKDADESCQAVLQRYPHCAQFRRENNLSLKLLDLPLLNGRADLAYCDADILFFRPFRGLFDWPDRSTNALFLSDSQNAYALRPWHLRGTGAIHVPPRLNSGLMCVRGCVQDLEFVEWFLKRQLPVFRRIPGWLEQTAWAALAFRAGCRVWAPAQLRVIHDAGCLQEDLVAGHFTSDVRHIFPQGLQSLDPTRPAVKVDSIDPGRLTPAELAVSQIWRFVGRRSRALIDSHVPSAA